MQIHARSTHFSSGIDEFVFHQGLGQVNFECGYGGQIIEVHGPYVLGAPVSLAWMGIFDGRPDDLGVQAISFCSKDDASWCSAVDGP